MMSLKRLLKRQSMITSWIKAGFWKWNIRRARQVKLMSGDLETPPPAPQLKGAECLSSSWFLPSGTSLQAPFSSPCISASHAHLAKPRPTAHRHPSSWALLGKGHASLLTDLTWNPWLRILGAFSHSLGCPPRTFSSHVNPLCPPHRSLSSHPFSKQLVTWPHAASRPYLHPARLAFRISLSSGSPVVWPMRGDSRRLEGGREMVVVPFPYWRTRLPPGSLSFTTISLSGFW